MLHGEARALSARGENTPRATRPDWAGSAYFCPESRGHRLRIITETLKVRCYHFSFSDQKTEPQRDHGTVSGSRDSESALEPRPLRSQNHVLSRASRKHLKQKERRRLLLSAYSPPSFLEKRAAVMSRPNASQALLWACSGNFPLKSSRHSRASATYLSSKRQRAKRKCAFRWHGFREMALRQSLRAS